jgi:hypothetical protein
MRWGDLEAARIGIKTFPCAGSPPPSSQAKFVAMAALVKFLLHMI